VAESLRAPAYAVGGCVRDWLLGLNAIEDLDVTVEGSGIDVAGAAARALGGTVAVHQQFGTATVGLTQPVALRVDFATCRNETYAKPGAYPRVAPGTLEEDLFRRDFAINAMAVALSPARFGQLVDPFHGAEDLARKRLRILHARSFLDDPSRILRGARLAHRFGLTWDPQTSRALQQALASGALGWLNAGRVRKELARMRQEPDGPGCLRALRVLVGEARFQELARG